MKEVELEEERVELRRFTRFAWLDSYDAFLGCTEGAQQLADSPWLEAGSYRRLLASLLLAIRSHATALGTD